MKGNKQRCIEEYDWTVEGIYCDRYFMKLHAIRLAPKHSPKFLNVGKEVNATAMAGAKCAACSCP
jgi:hypothetical protein